MVDDRRKRDLPTDRLIPKEGGEVPAWWVDDLRDHIMPPIENMRLPPKNRRVIRAADAGTTRNDATTGTLTEDPRSGAPEPSFPWLRSRITAARDFLANGGLSWRRSGPPPPHVAPTTAAGAAGSFAQHVLRTAEGAITQAVPAGLEHVLNWYDFARTGYAGFIRPQEMLAPAGGGAAGYLTAAGRTGTLGVFGGDVAARNLTKAGRPTAQAALELARQMEGKGFSEMEIRQATNEFIGRHDPALGGVHKGAEGAWRFEISDAGAKLKRDMPPFRHDEPLGNVLHHPELFAAYPNFRKIPVRGIGGEGGWFMRMGPAAEPFLGPGIIGIGGKMDNPLAGILHEVGHGVQVKEGWAEGGSPTISRQIRDAVRLENLSLDMTVQQRRFVSPAEAAALSGKKFSPESIVTAMSPPLMSDARAQWNTAHEAYMLHAGEAEARNIEARMQLAAGERREIHPTLTEDRPRSKQFVVKGGRLQRVMQEPIGRPQAVTLRKLREMKAPNGTITTFAFEMVNANGVVVGKLNGAHYPLSGELSVQMIQLKNMSGKDALVKHAETGERLTVPHGEWMPEQASVALLKPGEIKAVIRGLKKNYPGIKDFSGWRQTGVRGRAGGPTDAFTDPVTGKTTIRLNPKFKAVTGLPPGVVQPQAPLDLLPQSDIGMPDTDLFHEWDRMTNMLENNVLPGIENALGPMQRHLMNYYMMRGTLRDRRSDPMLPDDDHWSDPRNYQGRSFELIADAHIGRSAIRRVEVVGVDDSGPLQIVTVKGLDGETYTAPMGGMFGLSSSPPIGSVGYAFMGNGRPDQAFLLGVEDPTLRPRDQVDGEVRLYAKGGQYIGMNANGDLVITGPGEVRP